MKVFSWERNLRLTFLIFAIVFGVLIAGFIIYTKIPFFDPPIEYGFFWVEPCSSIHWLMETGQVDGEKPDSWITEYAAYDGSYLSKSREYYSSSSEAKRALQKYLKRASRIVKNSSTFDEQGNVVGHRTVAFFPTKEGKNVVVIVWTDKGILYSIKSLSLEIALEFENDLIKEVSHIE